MMSASEASFLSLFLFSFEIHASRVSHVYAAGISRAYFSSVSFVLHTHTQYTDARQRTVEPRRWHGPDWRRCQ